MVMIELSESEKPMAPPSPNFSAPFASPSLRWACKKRLRCFHTDATVTAIRLSPSPSPDRPPRPCFRSIDTAVPLPDACAATGPFVIRSPASESPPPPSRRARTPVEGDGGEPLLAAAPDASSRAAKGIGWSLRSGVRNAEVEEGKKKKRRVELWVSLSMDEIEQDFLWMTGTKPPPRRTRRRDKAPSHHRLLGVFPGSWLPNKFTAARYRVAEPSEPRKD